MTATRKGFFLVFLSVYIVRSHWENQCRKIHLLFMCHEIVIRGILYASQHRIGKGKKKRKKSRGPGAAILPQTLVHAELPGGSQKLPSQTEWELHTVWECDPHTIFLKKIFYRFVFLRKTVFFPRKSAHKTRKFAETRKNSTLWCILFRTCLPSHHHPSLPVSIPHPTSTPSPPTPFFRDDVVLFSLPKHFSFKTFKMWLARVNETRNQLLISHFHNVYVHFGG